MITVNRQSAAGKWFLFCNHTWLEFTSWCADEDQTNLCIYFWVTIAAPITILVCHLILFGSSIYTLYFIITKLQFEGIIREAIIISIFVGIVTFIVYISRWFGRCKVERQDQGFCKLFWTYVKSTKRRVCPLIKLED